MPRAVFRAGEISPRGQLPEGVVRSLPKSQGTCPHPRCTFPENWSELRQLLHRVTPALFDFPLKTEEPSSLPPAPGTRQAPGPTCPGPPYTSPTIPWKHGPLAAILFFQGEMDQGPCCNLCRENENVSRQDFGGPYLRSRWG